MKRLLGGLVRSVFEPRLDRATGTGRLDDEELRAVCALLRGVAGDESASEEACRRYVMRRTESVPGLLREYRQGIALLERAAAARSPGRRFADLAPAARDRVLARVLRRYRHADVVPGWLRRLGLTPENFEVVFAPRAHRRLRVFVARDLLLHYFTSPGGWSVVGREDSPGWPRTEREAVEVVGFVVEPDRIVLQLSDATVEELDPERLQPDQRRGLRLLVKSGRQEAFFSRKAYYEFCELFQESADGYVLPGRDGTARAFSHEG